MGQKRKAKEAFSGQVSAFAAAQKIRTQSASQAAAEVRRAAAIAGASYDNGQLDDRDIEHDGQDRATQNRPLVRLSQYDRRNVKRFENGIEITLDIDHSIACVGEFDLHVLDGLVSIYGAMLHPASGIQRVYALSSGTLPSVVAKKPDTRIRILSVRHGIQVLGKYSPLFRSLGSANDDFSFAPLRTTADDTLNRPLALLEVDEDTRRVLSRINARLEARETPRVMAVGPKSTGKSTLNRLLCNMIVTRPGGGRCYYLDLDCGQPEFGPPGQISLVEVNAPLLGPSYTHLASSISTMYRLLCCHTIAATSFKDDPEHYVGCVIDLCRRLPKNVPLVINTCGWVTGLGATILVDLLSFTKASEHVILDNVDAVLADSLRSTGTIHTIPRRQIRTISLRTPAELRAMQTMAYFHQAPGSQSGGRWLDESIGVMRSWMVSYAANKPGITAILSYGQAPDSDYLAEVLAGALVAIMLPEPIDAEAVKRTTQEDLPYIVDSSIGCSAPLDPSQSKLIGYALVRAIDPSEKRLHLITPLSDHEVAALLNQQIVLGRGAFDSPDWSYLEDLCLAEAQGMGDQSIDDERPWVSKREAHVGVEGAVWRLRHPPTRDAMK